MGHSSLGYSSNSSFFSFLGSICLYPNPHELESLIMKGLIKKQKSEDVKYEESGVVFQFLTFSYLLSLYLQHPRSPLFSPSVDVQIQTDAGQDLPQFPEFSTPRNNRSMQRADSWDLVQVFKSAGAPDPRNIAFP